MVAEKGSSSSNLDCFLHCTTPVVPSRILPKSEMRKLNKLWHPWERENVEFFTLGDLWNCFDEWSFYGVEVPISLNITSKNKITQVENLSNYYVPYLSALQIFTSTPNPHIFREDSDSGDGDTRDSYSESLSDESDKVTSSKWDGWSSEDGGSEQDISWQLYNRLGYIYCEYFERSTPYVRLPLKDKIINLARNYPGLMTLKSVDLSPASWMAVSWFVLYPIYSIPMGRTTKDLSTSFLTYHTLSSSFQGMDVEDDMDGACLRTARKQGEGIPLEPFGLATYKMQGDLWWSGRGGRDKERLASFLGVADSWLKQLGVQHHDFKYFNGIRSG
ncbi:hypothetical protein V2J09_002615 [Rumex salicifolius]